jgi:hypothetical protein
VRDSPADKNRKQFYSALRVCLHIRLSFGKKAGQPYLAQTEQQKYKGHNSRPTAQIMTFISVVFIC